MGTAVSIIREHVAAEAGRPILATHQQLVAQRGPDALPDLRRLVTDAATHGRESFHSRIITVLYGIACRKSLDWRSIESLLDEGAVRPS